MSLIKYLPGTWKVIGRSLIKLNLHSNGREKKQYIVNTGQIGT